MTIVVDASVALKWFIDEEGRDEARALALGGQPLIAPDLICAELANAAWKAIGRGDIGEDEAAAMMPVAIRSFSELVPTYELAERALEIALVIDHPAYDGFYLALAERTGTALLTADNRLLRKVRSTRFSKLVRPLGRA